MAKNKKKVTALDFIRGNIIYYFGEFSEDLRCLAESKRLKGEELDEVRKEIKWAISCFNSMKTELTEINDRFAMKTDKKARE